ncbi:hypothetical protein SESBI_47111 [Sesbania bispinosa]|nr:hypothetical protein SESBI_47111 [Sesbania bispinosa]
MAGLSSATPPEYDGEGRAPAKQQLQRRNWLQRNNNHGSVRIRRCDDMPLVRMQGCSCEVRRHGPAPAKQQLQHTSPAAKAVAQMRGRDWGQMRGF